MPNFLDPNYFWGLVFVVGAVILLFSVVGGGVKLTTKTGLQINLPSMLKRWRLPCFVVAVLLVGVSVAFMLFTNWAGWSSSQVKAVTHDSARGTGAHSRSRLLSLAYAQSVVVSFRVLARHAYVDTAHFGQALGFYLGDISLTGPAQLIVFQPTGPVDPNRAMAPPNSGVIASGLVGRGQNLGFSVSGTTYSVTADLQWYASGPNVGDIRVYR